MKGLIKVLSAIDGVNEWLGKAVSYLALAIIAIMMYEVIARYVFNAPTTWGVEMATFVFAAMWLFAGGYALRHDRHVKVDVIYSRFSPRTKAIIDCVTSPLFFFMVLVVIWINWKYALLSIRDLERSSSQWGPPVYIVKTLIPIGACFVLIQGIAKFIRDLYRAIFAKELA